MPRSQSRHRKKSAAKTGRRAGPSELPSDRQFLHDATIEVVENQIRDLTPPETKRTYERLLSEGHSEEQAMRLLGCVVVAEIFEIVKQNREFDEERYIQALNALPTLPGEGED